MTTRFVTFTVALFLLMLLVGCSAGASSTGAITVADGWARPAAGMGQPGAGYLTIANSSGQADALLGVSCALAGSVQMHETSMDSSGMMGMHPVTRIEVPAGGVVKLEPGGYHLMLMDLSRALQMGETIQLELTFEHAGKVTVAAHVRQG